MRKYLNIALDLFFYDGGLTAAVPGESKVPDSRAFCSKPIRLRQWVRRDLPPLHYGKQKASKKAHSGTVETRKIETLKPEAKDDIIAADIVEDLQAACSRMLSESPSSPESHLT